MSERQTDQKTKRERWKSKGGTQDRQTKERERYAYRDRETERKIDRQTYRHRTDNKQTCNTYRQTK